MKIYITNYDFNILYSKLELLKNYLKETFNVTEVYSENGIYQIDSNNIYKLEIKDKPVKIYDNYFNNLNLLVDLSSIEKKRENYVPVNGIEKYVKNVYYCLDSNTKIKLLIQFDNNTSISNKNNIINFYFEVDEKFGEINDNDLNNYFIKKQLNVFLSILN